ncbi:MAG: hypothetical protein LBJ14_08910 [Desulfarculales bacterium]|nr:hypothetical protein [Desulfarculales bacterium]
MSNPIDVKNNKTLKDILTNLIELTSTNKIVWERKTGLDQYELRKNSTSICVGKSTLPSVIQYFFTIQGKGDNRFEYFHTKGSDKNVCKDPEVFNLVTMLYGKVRKISNINFSFLSEVLEELMTPEQSPAPGEKREREDERALIN